MRKKSCIRLAHLVYIVPKLKVWEMSSERYKQTKTGSAGRELLGYWYLERSKIFALRSSLESVATESLAEHAQGEWEKVLASAVPFRLPPETKAVLPELGSTWNTRHMVMWKHHAFFLSKIMLIVTCSLQGLYICWNVVFLLFISSLTVLCEGNKSSAEYS